MKRVWKQIRMHAINWFWIKMPRRQFNRGSVDLFNKQDLNNWLAICSSKSRPLPPNKYQNEFQMDSRPKCTSVTVELLQENMEENLSGHGLGIIYFSQNPKSPKYFLQKSINQTLLKLKTTASQRMSKKMKTQATDCHKILTAYKSDRRFVT